MIDETVYQATIEDSSLSSDGEIPVVVAEVDELDFASLPSTSFPAATPAMPLGGHLPTTSPATAATYRSKTARMDKAGNGSNQQLLLGIGLALATVALLATLATVMYTVTRPQNEIPQKIKATEQGKEGERIIIVQ